MFGSKDRNRDKQPDSSQVKFASLSGEAKELRRLNIILGLSKKLNSVVDLQSLLIDIVDSAVEITGAERGFLMLLENPVKLDHRLLDPVITPPPQQNPKMEFRVARNASKKDLNQASFKISMTIANQVAESCQTVWVQDARSERRLKTSDSVTNLDLRTILCVPMKLDTKTMGVIYVDSKFIVRTFTEEDLLTFEALAEHAAVAVGKARMYEELLQKSRIEQENQELRAIDRKKSDFINMLSHEFRTPLTVLQGYAERLKSGKATDLDQVKNHASIMYEESKRLSRMVDDLVDISRIKSGRDKINRVDSDLTVVIERAAETLKTRAESKQIKMTVAFAQRPITLGLDQDKILQLMINLLDNAVKYTPEKGLVQVLVAEIPTLEVQGDVFIAGFAQVSVSDTGIGITPEDRERIFDEFYRTGSALNSKEQGTGLGLSICRGIVQAHGGRIWVESQAGKGSKFIFTLPNYQPISKLPEYKFHSDTT
jgi:signal transduction histidine kinase